MKFDASDRADGSQLDDRRGSSGGRIAMGGGLGIVGVLVVVAAKLFSGDPEGAADVLRDGIEQPRGGPQPPQQTKAPITGSCQGVDSTNDPAKFIVCVETNVQAFWQKELARMGTTYQPAKLVLFTERTESGCGAASASTGPFYCPPDQKVYLDLGFFAELQKRFHAKGGDFAEAYVVAHEYGHHVQGLLGTEEKVHAAQARHPQQKNALSVSLELQADCYAGAWGHAAYEKGNVSAGEIAQALDAAAAIGDDRIQKEMRGRVTPETFTHGTSAKRQKWFTVGMETGDPRACDTFSDQP